MKVYFILKQFVMINKLFSYCYSNFEIQSVSQSASVYMRSRIQTVGVTNNGYWNFFYNSSSTSTYVIRFS